MRETLWLYLRNSGLGRRLRLREGIARPLHALGCRLLPKRCRVRSGPCRDLFLQPSPSWPTDLWQGNYEAEVQAVVDAMLGPGKVFYDVGGGVGLYSLLAARKGARVFVFEPHPANAKCIASHARMNSLEGSIQVVPLAAYSSSGQIAMGFTQHGSQMALPGPDSTLDGRGLLAACITLDEFSRFHPTPTLVKIDVEGGESEVLKGSVELFERAQPTLICEVHDAKNEGYVRKWLAARGYSARWLEPPNLGHHLLGEPGRTCAG